MLDNKKSRFREAPWFSKVDESKTPIIVGGAGGIGSWLLILLSRIVNNSTPIYVFDFDRVEEINMAGQAYGIPDINKNKVQAITDVVKRLNGTVNIVAQQSKYVEGSITSSIMFSCFDNMQARKDMFENWKKEVAKTGDGIFIDGRLLAEQFQVFYVTPDKIEKYERYLFDDSEVEAENCSYKQTSHFAANIAAKMIQGYTHWSTRGELELPFYYEEIGNLFLTASKEE